MSSNEVKYGDMSGHSKWSKVKHQKAVTDVVKAKAFTKATQAITLAVKEGGGIGDPNKNIKLRFAIEQAKNVNMPKDNIIRAIEKAGSKDAVFLERVIYEAYGPKGIPLIIEAASDNRNRTVSQIKQILEHEGGHLASSGSVLFQFSSVGKIVILKNPKRTYDFLLDIALDIGAIDIQEQDDYFLLYTPSQELHNIVEKLTMKQIPVAESELIMKPNLYMTVSKSIESQISKLINKLEELDDVQSVYSNLAL